MVTPYNVLSQFNARAHQIKILMLQAHHTALLTNCFNLCSLAYTVPNLAHAKITGDYVTEAPTLSAYVSATSILLSYTV